MDKAEIIKEMERKEKEEAVRKSVEWKREGSELLESEALIEKWCTFVDVLVNNEFIRGSLVGETLEIIKMIKNNVPAEEIAQTLNEMPSGMTIIEDYLASFVPSEIVDAIRANMGLKIL